MQIFIDSATPKLLQDKYIFLDNDFLSQLFNDEDVFIEIISKFPSLLIDPLTEFEFLRDVFLPEQRKLKEEFIRKKIFLPVANHQTLFLKIQENALVLSKIYAHQNQNNKNSLVDLFLAARLMYQQKSSVLITGNKKDFPSHVFDVLTVINIEQKDGLIRPFSAVMFNKEKFDDCYSQLESLEAQLEKTSGF